MNDPKDPRVTSTYKPATDNGFEAEKPKKTHARLNEAGVPISLWDPAPVEDEEKVPSSPWQTYPKPLREPTLPHSDKKPGDLFRHVEVEIDTPDDPMSGEKKPAEKDNKGKIPMW
jgi:hypothetical protein